MDATVLDLPWPPSVNHYWRRAGRVIHVSAEGKAYRKTVAMECIRQRCRSHDGELCVSIEAYPPDRRRRDLDNVLKSLLDSLQHGGAYEDDSQISRLAIVRCDRKKGGRVRVTIREQQKMNMDNNDDH